MSPSVSPGAPGILSQAFAARPLAAEEGRSAFVVFVAFLGADVPVVRFVTALVDVAAAEAARCATAFVRLVDVPPAAVPFDRSAIGAVPVAFVGATAFFATFAVAVGDLLTAVADGAGALAVFRFLLVVVPIAPDAFRGDAVLAPVDAGVD
jgi:hypothetical protein